MLEVCVLKSLKLTVIHIQLWMWMRTLDAAAYAQSFFLSRQPTKNMYIYIYMYTQHKYRIFKDNIDDESFILF